MQAQRNSNGGLREGNKSHNTLSLSTIEKLSVMEALDHLHVSRQYQELGSCLVCKKISIKKCPGCSIFYCSIECQTFDWPKHRNTCSRHQDNLSESSLASSRRLRGATSLKSIHDESFLMNDRGSPFTALANQLSKKTGNILAESRSWANLKIGNRQYQSRGRHLRDESGISEKDVKIHHSSDRRKPSPKKGISGAKSSPDNKKTTTSRKSFSNNDEGPKVVKPIESTLDYKVTTPKCLFDLSLKGKVEVVGTFRESINRYWVMDVNNLGKYEEIQVFLNKNCKNFETVEPVIDQVYGCTFANEWFRGEIVTLSPEVVVHFIDYGNTSNYDSKVFKKLPDNLQSLPGLAFLIEFEEGTPDHYKTKDLDSLKLTIKETTKAFDGVPRVSVVEGEFGVTEKPLRLAKPPEKKKIISRRESLNRSVMDSVEANSSGKLVLLPGEGKLRFASIIPDNHKEAIDCFEKVTIIDNSNLAAFQAEVGDYVLVTDKEGNDQRGKVVMKLSSTYYVRLIDCGNVITSENVYPLPDELCGLIELGVKITVNEVLLEDQLKKLETCFYTVSGGVVLGKIPCILRNQHQQVIAKVVLEKPAEISEWKPSYVCLKSGSTVEISSISSANSFYVRSVNAEVEQKFLDMNMEMVQYATKAEHLEIPPLPGELCCAKFQDDGCFYRAVINSIEKKTVWVLFVDFGNEQETDLRDVKPLPDNLKNVPFFASKVKLKGVSDKGWNNMIKDYIAKLTSENIELTLTYSGSISDGVILREEVSGVVVNDFIEKARDKPTANSNTNIPKKSEIFLDDDMKNTTIEPGSTCALAILYVSKAEFETNHTFWATTTEEENFNYVNIELSTLISEHCDRVSTPYKPSYRELCLAEFEGSWYRAICAGSSGNTYKVFFVDFGNCCNLKCKSIRKMQKEFMKAPALAMNCTLDGHEILKGNAELTNQVCEQLIDRINTIIEGVTVTKFEEDTYFLKIPEIQNLLSG